MSAAHWSRVRVSVVSARALSLFCLLITLALGQPASAGLHYVTLKLSGSLTAFTDVQVGGFNDYAVSPDGQYAVFVADKASDETYELYSVRLQGNRVPVRLSSALPSGHTVWSFAISPDSQRVVYRAHWTTCCLQGILALYSVPINGGTPTQLSGPATGTPTSGVADFQISPDSSRVVYRFRPNVDSNAGLYSVPLAGGTITQLNDPNVDSDTHYAFAITADSGYVLYGQPYPSNFPILRVPVGGGAVVPLSDSDLDFDGQQIEITADGELAVFLARQEFAPGVHAFSVPISGGDAVQLNADLVTNGNVTSFLVSPDDQYVVYQADQHSDETFELFSVPTTGGNATKLNGTLPTDADTYAYEINAASSYVVFAAGSSLLEKAFLSVPLEGGVAVQLSNNSETHVFSLSPDGTQVVFGQNKLTDSPELYEFFGIPIEGGSAIKLSPAFDPGGGTLSGTVTPDNEHAVYYGRSGADNGFALFSVSLSGGPAVQVSAYLPDDRNVSSLWSTRATTIGQCTFYVADLSIDNAFELATACPFDYALNIPLFIRH